jgi:hypothetical protein
MRCVENAHSILIKLALPWPNHNPTKVTSELDHISSSTLALYRMADHRFPSQQVNPSPVLANVYPHPALHQLQGQVRRVAFLTVSPIIDDYLCISYVRTLMRLAMSSRASIGKASLNLWLHNVKCSTHDTSTHPITMRHTTILSHHMQALVIHMIFSFPSDCDAHNSIRKFPMCICIRMTELPDLSKPKHTPLLRCVGPSFSTSTYLFNQIISCRRPKRFTMAMVLTYPRLTPRKLSPESGSTQLHRQTCRRQRMLSEILLIVS